MRALLTGWFSFPDMGTTAGDLIVRDVVAKWLKQGNVAYDVAAEPQFGGEDAVNWRRIDPNPYTDVIFVCGPFGNGWPVNELLERFHHCRLTGINLSLLHTLSQWNPFAFLLERDHNGVAHADIAFAGSGAKVPVVGVILAHKQKEYGQRAMHELANEKIAELTTSREMSVVAIDTALGNNKGGLRTAREIESLIAAVDVVVTTRLHGTVLALKNEVPVIPIDPIAAGAKITVQVTALQWPLLFQAPDIDIQQLNNAFDFCLTPEAVAAAKICAYRARGVIAQRRQKFLAQLDTWKNAGVEYRG
jgi:hypothetical protein